MTSKRVGIAALLFISALWLSGCATGASGGPRLSSLAREVYPWPLQGQTAEVMLSDDQACERWARATKGPNEPFPVAEMRYGVCMLARGYEVGMAPANVGPPRLRVSAGRLSMATLDDHVLMLRAARADKLAPGSFDRPFGVEDITRDHVIGLMRGIGYSVTLTDMTVWPPPNPLEGRQ